ncbi:copper resistance CopC family protein [Streptomyces prunicolor]|uniref:copper resistance CopC family protein n=1 Tax=Streptomyces prunicolor TaxID=67348 RepID=UPI0004760581|nr:copper resistance protein CopC [Streptomyces prunicolor]
MRGLRLLRAPAALLGCLGVLLLSVGTPAYAHTALKDATPAPGSTVGTGTSVVELTFAQLQPGTTPKVSLVGPTGTVVPVGRPVVADGSVTCAAVSPLQAGVNTLTYTVTATDGDTQTNAFQFQVADSAREVTSPTACKGLTLAAPAAATSADPDDTILGLGRTTAFAVLAAVAVVVVGGGLIAVRMTRGTRPTGRRRATG